MKDGCKNTGGAGRREISDGCGKTEGDGECGARSMLWGEAVEEKESAKEARRKSSTWTSTLAGSNTAQSSVEGAC
jgi:hypothetical protein